MISQRIQNLQESKTLEAAARARALKAEGKDIISLTLGEPDFNTPEAIIAYMNEELKKGKGQHYAPAAGEVELRQAIAKYYTDCHGVKAAADEVFTANGVKMVLYYLFQTLLDPGDEVLIPSPYWVSYVDQVKLAGGKPVIVDTYQTASGELDVKALEEKRTEKTKILVLNSPANPDGHVLSADRLLEIGHFAKEHGLLIITDEIYNRLLYQGVICPSLASLDERFQAFTITVNGVSKAYAMTGWRLGYCLAPKEIIQALTKLASQGSGSPSGPAQYATIGALTGSQASVEAMRQQFEERLKKAHALLQDLPGFACGELPQGAFYLFPHCQKAAELLKYPDVDALAQAILEEAGVATVAGSAFGQPEYLRFSCATASETFAAGIERIRRFMAARRQQLEESSLEG